MIEPPPGPWRPAIPGAASDEAASMASIWSHALGTSLVNTMFVLDEPSGRYVLEDGVERLIEQRKRRVGHMAKLEAIAAAEARAAAPQPVEPPDAKRSGRLHGLGAPKHAVRRVSAEGATGQSLGRTA